MSTEDNQTSPKGEQVPKDDPAPNDSPTPAPSGGFRVLAIELKIKYPTSDEAPSKSATPSPGDDTNDAEKRFDRWIESRHDSFLSKEVPQLKAKIDSQTENALIAELETVLKNTVYLGAGFLLVSVAAPTAWGLVAVSAALSLGFRAGSILVTLTDGVDAAKQYEVYSPLFDPFGLPAYAIAKYKGMSEDDAIDVAALAGVVSLVIGLAGAKKDISKMSNLYKSNANVGAYVGPAVAVSGNAVDSKSFIESLTNVKLFSSRSEQVKSNASTIRQSIIRPPAYRPSGPP